MASANSWNEKPEKVEQNLAHVEKTFGGIRKPKYRNFQDPRQMGFCNLWVEQKRQLEGASVRSRPARAVSVCCKS